MSYRPELVPQQVITNGDMSGDLTSLPTIIQKLSMPSYQVSWVGSSPVGTLSVEVSNTFSLFPDGSVKNAGVWDALTLSFNGSLVTTIPVTGTIGSQFIDILETSAYAIRLIYTAGSGTGSLLATIAGKVS